MYAKKVEGNVNVMNKDLTQGNIYSRLIRFSIPLILGNLFQLTYNVADSIIIGRFAGDDALASVGICDPVMNFLILGISGMCIGASVLMSNSYGAGKYAEIKKAMETILVIGMSLSVVIAFLGYMASDRILVALNTPKGILKSSLVYLRIIFIGMPFTCMYNIYSHSLRSIGDSKTPLYFLAISSLLNVILDVVFIYYFSMDTLGAALSTVIAQAFSSALCIIYVKRRVPLLNIKIRNIRPDKKMMASVVRYGSVTALQQCSQPVGKLFIQGMVNTLGVNVIAAFNAVGKIEDFALVPERSIGNAMMTFTAQNFGSDKKDRVRKGFRAGLILEVGYFAFICIFIFLSKSYLLSPFSNNHTTLTEGCEYFSVMAFFYILPGLTNGIQGFFRGMKRMKTTLVATVIQISIRVLFTWLLIGKYGISGIAFACFAGWIGMLVFEIPRYFVDIRKELSQ